VGRKCEEVGEEALGHYLTAPYKSQAGNGGCLTKVTLKAEGGKKGDKGGDTPPRFITLPLHQPPLL